MKSFSESISTGQNSSKHEIYQDTPVGPSTDTEICQAFANAMAKKWDRITGSRLKGTMKKEEYKAARKSVWDRAYKHVNNRQLKQAAL